MTLIASGPNVGKTMLMLNMASWFATHGNPTMFYSLEQPRGEIGQRLVAILLQCIRQRPVARPAQGEGHKPESDGGAGEGCGRYEGHAAFH